MVCLRNSGGRLTQNDLQVLLNKASWTHSQGDFIAAESFYREALVLAPHKPEILNALAILSQQRGSPQKALEWIDAALTSKPDFMQARFNRSVILRALGRNAEALQSIIKILSAAPHVAVAWDMAGQIFKDAGDLEQAAKYHQTALNLLPNNAHFLGNYALVLFTQGDLTAAYNMVKKARELDSTYPPILMGNILRAWGHPEEAAKCFSEARAILPNLADAYASEAMARLQMGDMEEGLALWEKRPDLSTDLRDIPFWQGQEVMDLILYEDQGFGDALQFLRYIPKVKDRAKILTLRVAEPLVALCAENFPDILVVPEAEPPHRADARCRLSSLPFICSTRLNTIPPAPYLSPPASDGPWPDKVTEFTKHPRIGLVWAGNANYQNNAQRSIAFETIAPLLSLGPEHFISLQKDPTDLPLESGVCDISPHLKTFADTASVISKLDLVVSVDTSTAHLAGALGKPVFILLPFNPDWRWLLEREDSPWYGSARLFRQKTPGDWDGVMSAISIELRKFIKGDESVLPSKKWEGGNLRQNPNAVPLPA